MIHVKAADARRAAALIAHHGVRDEEGMNALINESIECERFVELLVAVLLIYDSTVPILHSDVGIKVIRRVIVDLAERADREERQEEQQQHEETP